MKWITLSCVLAFGACGEAVHAADAADAPSVAVAPSIVIVCGAAGSEEFGAQFQEWTARWQDAAKKAQAECLTIGVDPSAAQSDRELLQARLAASPGAASPRPLWLVLIGHGTFDGRTARFNLRGPDVSAPELAEWLQGLAEPVAVINCASSSGAFLAELSGKGRVVITATQSGHEYNYARFGDYLSQAVADSKADLDKDEQTSLLEAYLAAAASTREFYAAEGRLVTEHALLDDNADRLGTPADWFRGLRPIKAAKDGAALDGTLAAQAVLIPSGREKRLPEATRQERDRLEAELAEARKIKAELPEPEYLALVEPILIKLARLYEQAEAATP